MPAEDSPSAPNLARLVGLRICHDLGGVAGTVGNALEMIDTAGPEATALAIEAATVLRQRLLLWRAMLGGQGEATLGAVLGLVEGQLAGGRARADIGTLDASTLLPEPLVPALLTALVLGGEALPRGGVVRLAGDLRRELAVLPDGPRAGWPPPLIRVLGGAPFAAEPTGRDVLPLWLAALAEQGGMRLGLALAPDSGAGPLLLSLPR